MDYGACLSLATSDTTCNMYYLLFIYVINVQISFISSFNVYVYTDYHILYVSCMYIYIYQLITCLKTRNFILVKYLLVSVNFVVITFLLEILYNTLYFMAIYLNPTNVN